MELYELLDAAMSDLEPMPYQVPGVLRIGRRKQEIRRSGLAAAGAVFVIGVGTLMISAPWSDDSGMPPASAASHDAYDTLVANTLKQLWPAADQGTLSGADVHLGAGLVPLPFMTQGVPPVQAALNVARMSAADAAADKPCPTISAAAGRFFFCIDTTLGDGTIVQLSNINEYGPYDIDTPPNGADFAVGLFPFQALPAISSPNPPMVPDGTSGITAVESLTVWQGDAVETLYLPYGFFATPSTAQLTAIGESSAFRQLLTTALDSGLVPAPGQPPVGVPSEMTICGTATGYTTYVNPTPLGGVDPTASQIPGQWDPFVPLVGCPDMGAGPTGTADPTLSGTVNPTSSGTAAPPPSGAGYPTQSYASPSWSYASPITSYASPIWSYSSPSPSYASPITSYPPVSTPSGPHF